MGVRKRIHPKGYGLDFSVISLKLHLSKYFIKHISVIKVLSSGRTLTAPPELRTYYLFFLTV